MSLAALIDELLSERQLRPEGLNIWLALWGEIAVNPALRAEHLRQYRIYHAALATAIARQLGRAAPDARDETLATALIALLDGIWLEFSIAPEEINATRSTRMVRWRNSSAAAASPSSASTHSPNSTARRSSVWI